MPYFARTVKTCVQSHLTDPERSRENGLAPEVRAGRKVRVFITKTLQKSATALLSVLKPQKEPARLVSKQSGALYLPDSQVDEWLMVTPAVENMDFITILLCVEDSAIILMSTFALPVQKFSI